MRATSENILIPLPAVALSADFPWRIRFIAAVDEQLRRLRATGHFVPARFFGDYFQGDQPIGVSGSWTVTLEQADPVAQLPEEVERATQGRYSIVSRSRAETPEFILIHDRKDGCCWLWRFAFGMRFVEAVEPFERARELDVDDAGNDGLFAP